jgi:hypothetical protein
LYKDKVSYLKKLVELMMLADSRRNPNAISKDPVLSGLVRNNPVLSLGSTDPLSIKAKQQQAVAVGLTASQIDDPWLVILDAEYVGKLCFLNDVSLRHKLYRICKIAYWDSSRTRNASWEATMEPVHVSTDGTPFVHDDDVVVMSSGKRLTKASALLGYVLAEYVDGDDAEPTRSDCVDKYVMDAMHKHIAYTSKNTHRQRPPVRKSLSPPRTSLSPPRPSRTMSSR